MKQIINSFVGVVLITCLACNKPEVNSSIDAEQAEIDNMDEDIDLPNEVENLDTDAGARATPSNTVYFQYQDQNDVFRSVYSTTDWYYGNAEPSQATVTAFATSPTHGEISKRVISAKGAPFIKSKKFALGWHIMKADNGEAVKFLVTADKRPLIHGTPTSIDASTESKLIRVKWKGTPPSDGRYVTYFFRQNNLLWKDYISLRKSSYLDYFEGFGVNARASTAKSIAFRINANGPSGYVTTTEDYPAVQGVDIDARVSQKKSAVVTFKYAIIAN